LICLQQPKEKFFRKGDLIKREEEEYLKKYGCKLEEGQSELSMAGGEFTYFSFYSSNIHHKFTMDKSPVSSPDCCPPSGKFYTSSFYFRRKYKWDSRLRYSGATKARSDQASER